MGLFDFKKTLGDLGLVEKEGGSLEHNVSTDPPPAPVSPPTPVRVAVTPPASTYTSSAPGSVDANVLNKLMEEVNSSAPAHYRDFQQMLVKMLNVPGMSPVARYQAAATAVNMTKEKVSEAVDILLKRLESEEAEYLEMIEATTAEKVGGLKTEVVNLNTKIEDNKRAIQALEEENRGHVVTLAKIEGDIATNTVSIERAGQTFNATAEHARAQIEAARTEANQYLSD